MILLSTLESRRNEFRQSLADIEQSLNLDSSRSALPPLSLDGGVEPIDANPYVELGDLCVSCMASYQYYLDAMREAFDALDSLDFDADEWIRHSVQLGFLQEKLIELQARLPYGLDFIFSDTSMAGRYPSNKNIENSNVT